MHLSMAVYSLESSLGVPHVSNKEIFEDYKRSCDEQQVLINKN